MADFIDALGTTGSVAGACAYVGKSRMSAYRLRNRADAGHFRAAWDEALRSVTAILADTAFQRAVEGVQKTIWYKGERIGEETVYNDRLLMYLLRVRDPHNYAPVSELDRAQRQRPIEPTNRLEATLDAVEAREEEWRRALEPPPGNGDAPALALLAQPASPASPRDAEKALTRVTSVTLKPAGSGAELQPGDAGDEREDEADPNHARRLVEEGDSDQHSAERADAAPDGVGGAHRNRAGGDLEQAHAERHRGEEAGRPGNVSKAVDEAQAGGEPDFEKPT
jgi:hypothetical protein